eukprot:976166-Rhodomonas_salina.1
MLRSTAGRDKGVFESPEAYPDSVLVLRDALSYLPYSVYRRENVKACKSRVSLEGLRSGRFSGFRDRGLELRAEVVGFVSFWGLGAGSRFTR